MFETVNTHICYIVFEVDNLNFLYEIDLLLLLFDQ